MLQILIQSGEETMNIKYLIPLASIALLLIGGAGRLADRSSGQVAVAELVSQPTQVQSPVLPGGEQANNGAVRSLRAQATPDTKIEVDDDVILLGRAGQPALTAAIAQQIAEARLNSGRARKVELDEEDGQLVYDVKIGNTKVEIDAQTGAVLSMKTDD
jgi:hypothetical protein